MSVPGFSVIALSWIALVFACTLITALIESVADARLPVPSAGSWPWGGEAPSHSYCGSKDCGWSDRLQHQELRKSDRAGDL